MKSSSKLSRTKLCAILVVVLSLSQVSKQATSQDKPDSEPEISRPFPELDKKHQSYLEELLDYWEESTKDLKSYETEFTSWTYNSMQVPMKEKETGHVFASTICSGKLQFSKKNRVFEVKKSWGFNKQQYLNKREPFAECPDLRIKLVASVTSLSEFLFWRKEVIEYEFGDASDFEEVLHGMPIFYNFFDFGFTFLGIRFEPLGGPSQNIAMGIFSMPFFEFESKKSLQEKYWIRVTTPKQAGEKGEYWLELYPKSKRDSTRFQKVEVILTKEKFLPKALTIYAPEHDLKSSRTVVKTTYSFMNRQLNLDETSEAHKKLVEELAEPQVTPFGWKRTVNNLNNRISQNPKATAPVQRK